MLFSKKSLFKIIFPLILQQIFTVTIGMVDSLMVSSAGEAAVSGVSLVSSLDLLLIYCFSALASGGAIVTAQFIGRGDTDLAKKSAKQLIYVTTIVASVIAILVIIIRYPLLSLLFGNVEDAVMSSAQDYFFFIALSFPMLGLYDSGAAILRSMGKSMESLTISVIMNIINVIGNAILIYGFGMGAAGAAIATLISRSAGAVIIIINVHSRKRTVYIEKLFRWQADKKIIKSILRIGVPSGIENGMFQFGKLLTQSLISSLSTAAIAANAIAGTLSNYQYMPGGAIGLATVTVIGQCVGAGEKEQAKKYSRILVGLTYLCLWTVCLFTVLFAKPIIGAYGVSAEASETAYTLLIIHSITAAIIWPTAFTIPHSFRAASDVRFPLIISATSMWIFRVASSFFLALPEVTIFGLTIPGLGLGVLGVWIAMFLDWLFRAVIYAFRYFKGKWLDHSLFKKAEPKTN